MLKLPVNMKSNDKKVTVVEVGPRDGFQMETVFIPTEQKIEIINSLIDAGLERLEATSFVSPKALPQMRDGAEVIAGVKHVPGVKLAALVPNPKGAERAAQAGVDEMVVFVSASESHNRSNVRRGIAESLEGFAEVSRIANLAGIQLHGAVAVAFGCPFEGDVAPEQVGRIAARMVDLGFKSITLGDTTGMATPPLVEQLGGYMLEHFPELELYLHFHNTRGIGLVNVYAALQIGLRRFESSVGGLGGCPFAPGATGNIVTEDLVYLLHECGYKTGINLDKLISVSCSVEEIIGRILPGQVMKSGPRLKLHRFAGSCA
jgi:hydroxymethylglutaryl-CoA lyase